MSTKTTEEWAREHRPDLTTPKGTMQAFQAAVIRGDRKGFLNVVHPEYRVRKYPEGPEGTIRFLDRPKYREMMLTANIGAISSAGGHARVEMVFQRHGPDGLESRTTGFQLVKLVNSWVLEEL